MYGTRLRFSALVVAVAVVLVSWTGSAAAVSSGWSGAILTADGGGGYGFTTTPTGLDVNAAAGVGSGTRMVLWSDVGPVVDQHVCATFNDNGWPAQAGVALRVTNDAGRVRAITVTRNVWAQAGWIFNVHLWDTAAFPAPLPARHTAGVDLTTSVGTDPLPWRLCASIIGTRLRFKVWPLSRPEPAWTDPRVQNVDVPADWTHAGRPGAYVGHLDPVIGGKVAFTDLLVGAGPALGAPTTVK